MFTGIITHIGRVAAIERAGDTRFTIATDLITGVGEAANLPGVGEAANLPGVGGAANLPGVGGAANLPGVGGAANVALGASIANNGVCLTVIDRSPGQFTVQASQETLDCTTLGDWSIGTPVNLERSLRLGDELGGHLVFGHVDGRAVVVSISSVGDSLRYEFEAPSDLARFIAVKGSVALDGVSLTVNAVTGSRFSVNIIPHTQQCTTFGTMAPGQQVNLEVDMLARYVARLKETM